MKNKILLFSNYNFNQYQGGPPGFISQNILNKDITGLITLQTLQEYFKPSLIKLIQVKLFTKNYSTFLCKTNAHSWLYQLLNSSANTYKYYNCSKFDYIYFHDIFALYGCLKNIPKFQKIILQSHSPELVSEEFKNLGKSQEEILQIEKIEKIAFETTDYLIFPNRESGLIYKDLIQEQTVISYILSASQSIANAHKMPLDNEAVNLLFIGRRNHIKGFDVLLDTFKKIRKLRKDVNLLLAGEGTCDDVYPDGVISLGKVDPAGWIRSVDYVINVNKDSYFDLSVMEVLSVGTPLILTLTGGHAFFRNLSEGIIQLDKLCPETLYELLANIQKQSIVKKERMVQANQALYKDYFTQQLYQQRLENFIDKLT